MSVLPLVDAIAGDTFRTLVRQFSQELCFYRELIQNAVDAGTQRVEVWTELQDGTAVVHVRDDGEGMDARAIDEHLTRLFASPKEDDLTKIGKFGIGFVSVFAIGPQQVEIDTGRGGQHWRIVFAASGEFERRLDAEPFEGTHIRIRKSMGTDEYATFLSRSEEAIRYWCRYCPVDIDFNRRRLNEPFRVDGPVQVRVEAQGTVVVAAIGGEGCGFYNGGITVFEGPLAEEWLSGIAFRINSRYLKHTLSRDGVRVDGHYRKALALLKRAVTGELMAEMYRTLAAEPQRLESCLMHVRRTLARSGVQARWIPQLEGPPLSLADLRQTEARLRALCRRLGVAPAFPCELEPGAVSKAAALCQIPTLRCLPTDPLGQLLQETGLPLGTAWLVPQDVSDANVPTQLRKLLQATSDLLRQCGVRFDSAAFGHWSPAERASVWRRRGQTLASIESAPAGHDRLLVHVSHPLVTRLTIMSETDMAGAAYLLARAVCLSGGVPSSLRGRLMKRSLEALR